MLIIILWQLCQIQAYNNNNIMDKLVLGHNKIGCETETGTIMTYYYHQAQ